MRAPDVWIIFRKELTDVLRDRRTILSMILFPIVLVPLLMIGLPRLLSSQVQKAATEVSTIAVVGKENASSLVARLPTFGLKLVEVSNVKEAIRSGQIQAALEFEPGWQEKVESQQQAPIVIYTDSTELSSTTALAKIELAINGYSEEILRARHVDPSKLKPFKLDKENVATEAKKKSFIGAMIIPYVLIFLCLVGATYIAIDLTAGERERGTLETLLVSPAGRLEIIVGKLLTVFTASMLSAILSMASMAATQLLFGGEIDPTGHGMGPTISLAVPPAAMGILLVLMIPLAVMFSALSIALSLFARSYKEAMTYLSPMMIMVILPTMLSMLPGFKASLPVAMIPVANVSLAMKEILNGQYSWGFLGVTFVSLIVLAVLSLFFAVAQFNRERVLFRS